MVGFTPEGAKRVARATRQVEKNTGLNPLPELGTGAVVKGRIILCKANSNIEAAATDPDVFKKGTAKVWRFSDLDDDDNGAVEETDPEEEITIWNAAPSIVASGKILFCVFSAGRWIVLFEACQ
jgi:hypothetical protein